MQIDYPHVRPSHDASLSSCPNISSCVTLSISKGLYRLAQRFFVLLRMTQAEIVFGQVQTVSYLYQNAFAVAAARQLIALA